MNALSKFCASIILKTNELCVHNSSFLGFAAAKDNFLHKMTRKPRGIRTKEDKTVFYLLRMSDLVQKSPNTDDHKTALELFSFYWRESRFRDVVLVIQRCSALQHKYIDISTGEEMTLVEEFRKLDKWPIFG